MTRIRQIISAAVLLIAAGRGISRAQTLPPTALEIDVENIVQYHEDTSDVSRFATIPTTTTPTIAKGFGYFLIIGDIVAVNGRPAKGTFVNTTRSANLRTAPNLGQAIPLVNQRHEAIQTLLVPFAPFFQQQGNVVLLAHGVSRYDTTIRRRQIFFSIVSPFAASLRHVIKSVG
jgi:hypothetical protein